MAITLPPSGAFEENIKRTAKYGKVSRTHAKIIQDMKCFFGAERGGRTIPLSLAMERVVVVTHFSKNVMAQINYFDDVQKFPSDPTIIL